jgi:hypothetical protein
MLGLACDLVDRVAGVLAFGAVSWDDGLDP